MIAESQSIGAIKVAKAARRNVLFAVRRWINEAEAFAQTAGDTLERSCGAVYTMAPCALAVPQHIQQVDISLKFQNGHKDVKAGTFQKIEAPK
ncbi:hypothetical protein [Bradyrhizobium iriomotense]|uniref:Uncharacterized protein n=1 Tax=Bradyrhizobium iriomotense TaxID=441950 RepID=A0ABQ6BC18_9BRAD|nr:hypothetical protein [Bradyrhizobium iriomotense]GLR91406.1 hypothetical protein GCM10007857_81230 [Bradyrhizobium iriomotense]